jgi:hypothetical protein
MDWELTFSLFFLLSGVAMVVRGAGFPRWIGYLGVVTAAAGMIGMVSLRSSIRLGDPSAIPRTIP